MHSARKVGTPVTSLTLPRGTCTGGLGVGASRLTPRLPTDAAAPLRRRNSVALAHLCCVSTSPLWHRLPTSRVSERNLRAPGTATDVAERRGADSCQGDLCGDARRRPSS